MIHDFWLCLFWSISSQEKIISTLGCKCVGVLSHSVMSDSLCPHGLQHTRLPYPSLSPRVCSNSFPLSQWCHLIILSSVIPFSSCSQFFRVSEYFPMNRPFASDGQSIGAWASASVLPMNVQGWFPLGLTGWIPLQCKRLSRVFSNTSKASIL